MLLKVFLDVKPGTRDTEFAEQLLSGFKQQFANLEIAIYGPQDLEKFQQEEPAESTTILAFPKGFDKQLSLLVQDFGKRHNVNRSAWLVCFDPEDLRDQIPGNFSGVIIPERIAAFSKLNRQTHVIPPGIIDSQLLKDTERKQAREELLLYANNEDASEESINEDSFLVGILNNEYLPEVLKVIDYLNTKIGDGYLLGKPIHLFVHDASVTPETIPHDLLENYPYIVYSCGYQDPVGYRKTLACCDAVLALQSPRPTMLTKATSSYEPIKGDTRPRYRHTLAFCISLGIPVVWCPNQFLTPSVYLRFLNGRLSVDSGLPFDSLKRAIANSVLDTSRVMAIHLNRLAVATLPFSKTISDYATLIGLK